MKISFQHFVTFFWKQNKEEKSNSTEGMFEYVMSESIAAQVVIY